MLWSCRRLSTSSGVALLRGNLVLVKKRLTAVGLPAARNSRRRRNSIATQGTITNPAGTNDLSWRVVREYESASNRAMNSRSSSTSFPPPRIQTRPSFSSRLSFAISSAEQGEAATAPNVAEHQIDEEIEEIKRYEVCHCLCCN